MSLPDDNPVIMRRFVFWVYSDSLSTAALPLWTIDDCIQLYALGEKWLLEELRSACYKGIITADWIAKPCSDDADSYYRTWKLAKHSKVRFIFACKFMELIDSGNEEGIETMRRKALGRSEKDSDSKDGVTDDDDNDDNSHDNDDEFFLDAILAWAKRPKGITRGGKYNGAQEWPKSLQEFETLFKD